PLLRVHPVVAVEDHALDDDLVSGHIPLLSGPVRRPGATMVPPCVPPRSGLFPAGVPAGLVALRNDAREGYGCTGDSRTGQPTWRGRQRCCAAATCSSSIPRRPASTARRRSWRSRSS